MGRLVTRVLAAVDNGPVSGAVIETAECLARVLAARLEVVTVDGDAAMATTAVGRDVKPLEGRPPAALCAAAIEPDVRAVVMGVRSVKGGPRPTGHVTEELITGTDVPVVTVPPEADPGCQALDHLLVPLEGDQPVRPSTEAILRAFETHGSVIDTVHVFDRSSVPMFWDGWHDHEIWSAQFARAYSPVAVAPDVRIGDVAQQILATADAKQVSLIVLEWKGRLDRPHAAVVHDLLCNSTVPLMLIPLGTHQE